MAPRERRHRRVVGGLALPVVAWLALLGFCPAAVGQVYYFDQRTFEIPYTADPNTPFRRIHLHVSTDSGKTYSKVASTLKGEGAFTYNALSDGWHFFVVQIELMDGTFRPARVEAVQPHNRICIDTEKPKATLRAVNPQDPKNSAAVEWVVSDANLDLQTLRLYYRPQGSSTWLPLDIRQMAGAQFEWNPTAGGPLEVRLLVSDKARHTTEVKTDLRADASRVGGSNPGGGLSRGGAGAAGEPKVIYVNRKSFNLNYNIAGDGPSKVRHVEVWTTQDTTQWSRLHEKASPTGPHPVTVIKAGRHGFTLRPISGVGRAAPEPRAGDMPQVWVEVDLTPPIVKLNNVMVNEGTDAGTMTVTWQASDKFLGDTPITIYYSTVPNAPESEWKVLQAKLENTGSHKCKNPEGLFEFYIRVEAVDQAGNKAMDQTRDKVNTDLSEPKVTDVNVTAGDPPNKPPM